MFLSACSSSDNTPAAPGPVAYTGSTSQAAITADNAEQLTTEALGFGLLGASSTQADTLAKASKTLVSNDTNDLTLAKGLSKDMGYGGYGGYFTGYGGLAYEVSARDLFYSIGQEGFPNISGPDTFSNTVTMTVATEATPPTITFQGTITFTDAQHCNDRGFDSSTPESLCSDVTRINASQSNLNLVFDISGYLGQPQMIEELSALTPLKAISELFDGTYRGYYYSGYNTGTYNFPYGLTMDLNGTLSFVNNGDVMDTKSDMPALDMESERWNGALSLSSTVKYDYPLDTETYPDEGYGGYNRSGYGGNEDRDTTVFNGDMEAALDYESYGYQYSKHVTAIDSAMTLSSEYVTEYETSDDGTTTTMLMGQKSPQNVVIQGTMTITETETADGLSKGPAPQGNMARTLRVTGDYSEDYMANSWERRNLSSIDTYESTYTSQNDDLHISFSGDAAFDMTQTVNVLSPVTQTLSMTLSDGAVSYASTPNSYVSIFKSYDSAEAGDNLNYYINTYNDESMTTSGSLSINSGDNFFTLSGSCVADGKQVYKHDYLLEPSADYQSEDYTVATVTADQVRITENNLNLGFDGSLIVKKGLEWDDEAGKYKDPETGEPMDLLAEDITNAKSKTVMDIDLVVANNLTGQTFWFENYRLVSRNVDGDMAADPDTQAFYYFNKTVLAITGTYHNSDLGYVTLATSTDLPFAYNLEGLTPGKSLAMDMLSEIDTPVFGQLELTGSNGTAYLTATQYTETSPPTAKGYTVSFDANGNTTIDDGETTSGTWPDNDGDSLFSNIWLFNMSWNLEEIIPEPTF
ncbi:MAG: hypothetical protein KKD44_12940 [Proteobacteria bacterium]|nr:hypothetical protein [Pseudomonadota bacterium]